MNYKKVIIWVFFSLIIFRVLSLGSYPLMDTSEPRYAEVARIMVETDDWITPQFIKGTPFWGKPPLSFWLTAISFKAFGVNEFSARLPSIICGILILLILTMSSKPLNIQPRLLPATILLSMLGFYIISGAVLTEPSLMLGMSLSMLAFLNLITGAKNHTWWVVGFAVGLSIGMLSKGPIAVILVTAPMFFWSLLFGQLKHMLKVIDLRICIPVFFILSLPWYLAAEVKTPGFLDYFIIGEHIQRFLDPGWAGDMYGNAHEEAKGKIWYFAFLGYLPWSLILPVILVLGYSRNKKVQSSNRLANKQNPPTDKHYTSLLKLNEMDYLLILWAVFPMVFFSFSSNILYTYAIPSMGAGALFFSKIILSINTRRNNNLVLYNSIGVASLFCILLLNLTLNTIYTKPGEIKSEKLLVQTKNLIDQNRPLYYIDKQPFSAQFYSSGKAINLSSKEIKSIAGVEAFVAVHKTNKAVIDAISDYSSVVFSNRNYILYKQN